MSTHVKVLGGLFIVFGMFGLLAAMLAGVGVAGAAGIAATAAESEDAALVAPILGVAGTIAATVLFVMSLPGIAAGIGLLKFKSWARILGIVLCAICLIGIPFGTIFGIYGLWVLLTKDAERLFEPGRSL